MNVAMPFESYIELKNLIFKKWSSCAGDQGMSFCVLLRACVIITLSLSGYNELWPEFSYYETALDRRKALPTDHYHSHLAIYPAPKILWRPW